MSVGLRLGLAVVLLRRPVFSAAASSASAPGHADTGPAASASHLAEEMSYAAPCRPQSWTHAKPDLQDPCFIAGSWATLLHGSCQVCWSSRCPMQHSHSPGPHSC